LLPVNSFWLSGCGVTQPEAANPPSIDESLRGPALADDWAAWCKAWQTLDAGPLAALRAEADAGKPAVLTLCGERAWARLEVRPRSLTQTLHQTLRGWWAPTAPNAVLETL